MNNGIKEVIVKINKAIENNGKDYSADEIMKLSQSTLNLANAMLTLDTILLEAPDAMLVSYEKVISNLTLKLNNRTLLIRELITTIKDVRSMASFMADIDIDDDNNIKDLIDRAKEEVENA